MSWILFTTRTGQPSYLLHFMFPMKTNLSYIKQIKTKKKGKIFMASFIFQRKKRNEKIKKIISFKKNKKI